MLDMSSPYRTAYDRVLPNAAQVADPLHVIRLANQRLDEVGGRVQNETPGHRGRKGSPAVSDPTASHFGLGADQRPGPDAAARSPRRR